MGLMKFLLIVITFYLIFKVVGRYLLPWAMKIWLQRFQKRFYDQNPHIRKDKDYQEGRVTIKKVKDEEAVNIPDDFGDYVDYEDVDDDKK